VVATEMRFMRQTAVTQLFTSKDMNEFWKNYNWNQLQLLTALENTLEIT
jgi:hypothetical protein